MTEYIEREALLETIEETTWYHVSTRGTLVEGAISDGNALYKADDVFKALEEAPTADVAVVRHGRYEMGIDEGDYEYGTCSVCGYNEYNAFGCCLPHNYCPNCGAKMDGKV